MQNLKFGENPDHVGADAGCPAAHRLALIVVDELCPELQFIDGE